MSAVTILAALLGVLIGGGRDSPPGDISSGPTPDQQVERALRQLLETNTYEELIALPASWRSELSSSQRKSLVTSLLPYLWSSQELELVLPEGVVLEARYDWSKGYPEEVRRAKQRIRHDLLTRAGRASWAIEELLLCSLPVVLWANAEESARTDAIAKACQAIIEAMELPVVDGTERATVAQRLAAGVSVQSSPRMLEELAKDSSPQVRAAVAANRGTPLKVVVQLLKDPEESVRTAAEENLQHARRLPEEERRRK